MEKMDIIKKPHHLGLQTIIENQHFHNGSTSRKDETFFVFHQCLYKRNMEVTITNTVNTMEGR